MRAVIGSYSMPVSWHGVAQRLGQQGEEQAGAHAGLQHAAAGKAQPLGGAPEARMIGSGV